MTPLRLDWFSPGFAMTETELYPDLIRLDIKNSMGSPEYLASAYEQQSTMLKPAACRPLP